MTIKEAEERTGLTRSNIRFYEKEGLIKPQRNTGNSYRDYSEKDIEELQKIAYLRTLGISIEEIRQVVEKRADLHEIVKRQIPLLEQQLSELHNAKRMCEAMLAQGEIAYEDLKIDQYVTDQREYWQENRHILRQDSVRFISMWGGVVTWAIITAVSLLTALCALWFLPEQIPIQWSGGEAVSFASKSAILVCPAACAVIRFLLRPLIYRRVRQNTAYGGIVSDYITNCLCLVALSVEIFMILYVGGMARNIAAVLLVEIVILFGYLWLCRRKLPVGGD
ncbi:MAG: MerR family transcriptional regulator [Acetatifactor sp.]|nr:MerR family transcriptional regulator [Acetatifactor sp.]